jgi:GNAT superfamily N-acetyltransferase
MANSMRPTTRMADRAATDAFDVRRLAPRDEAAWRPLWDGYLHFYRRRLPEAVTGATFQRLCTGQDGMAGLVAVDQADEAIGLAHLVFHVSTWTTASYCYLEDLFVAAAWRGAGVARALIEAVYREADERGAARVYWTTQEFNAPARSLYDQVAHRTSFIRYER